MFELLSKQGSPQNHLRCKGGDSIFARWCVCRVGSKKLCPWSKNIHLCQKLTLHRRLAKSSNLAVARKSCFINRNSLSYSVLNPDKKALINVESAFRIAFNLKKKKRLASTLRRAVRALSDVSGEVGTSAFSLAMLVFLVQEARTAALSRDAVLTGQPMGTSELDAVRQVFGDSASDQVAGIDYTAIAAAVAQISDLYAQEALAEDSFGADLAAGAEQGGLDAELELVGRYLRDAVQYAQLSAAGIAAEGTEAAVAGEGAVSVSAASADEASVLPSVSTVAGAVAVSSLASTPSSVNHAPTVAAALTAGATEAATSSVTLDLFSGASDVDTSDGLSLSGVTYTVGTATASSTVPTGLSLSSAGVLTVDPTSSAFIYLAADQTLDIVVRYTISDGNGGTVAQTATITITGAAQTTEISLAAANTLYTAGTYYSDDDYITVDVTSNEISAAGSLSDLSLSALDTLGVDVIDIDGSGTNVTLHVDSADTLAMSNAGLSFATGDNIVLDVTTDELGATLLGGNGTGSYLAGTLDSSLSSASLSMSALVDLGVSVVDIGGSDSEATLHISVADFAAMQSAGLSFASADTIVQDGTDYPASFARSFSSTTTAEKLASAVGDSLGLHAMGIDKVEVDNDVLVTLHEDAGMAFGADQSLKNLLLAMDDSGVTSADMANSVDAVSAVAVGADANFAISDAMVSALMDAGLLTANTDSTIEVDTSSEHMSTSLSQLADIGADKVVTSEDVVYVDLGHDVANVVALSTLLAKLASDDVAAKFVQADGAAVAEVGLVLSAQQAALATAIQSSSSVLDQLTSAGITELLVACDNTHTTADVTLLGQDYYKVPVA